MSCLALFTRSSHRCRTDGRIYVMWLGEALLEPTQVDAIIAQTSGIMKAYADKGFTAAGSNASIWIVVDRSVSAPSIVSGARSFIFRWIALLRSPAIKRDVNWRMNCSTGFRTKHMP